MNRIAMIMATAALALGVSVSANAGQYSGPGFSGVAWYGESGIADQEMGAINVDSEGFRMEVEEQGQRIVVLMFWGDDTAYSLMMNERMYLEVPAEQMGGGPGNFQGRPCDGYSDARLLGSETVNGRVTEKWRCTGELELVPDREAGNSTSWFDPNLGFPVREVSDAGDVFEVRDIAVGRQDTSLFEIPAGFQKLDVNALMQQLMQQQQ